MKTKERPGKLHCLLREAGLAPNLSLSEINAKRRVCRPQGQG